MEDETLHRVVALAAGLKSVGNSFAARYADTLLGQSDLSRLEQTSESFLRFLKSHKGLAVMPAIASELRQYAIPDLWELHALMAKMSSHRLGLLEPAFPLLKAAGVDVMPYKGIDLMYSFPNTVGGRFMADVDPLVPFDQVPLADKTLRDNGFVQGWVDRSQLNEDRTGPRMTSIPQAELDWVLHNHHETHPYFVFASPDWLMEALPLIEKYSIQPIIEGRPYIEANVDLHHSIASGFQPEDIWPGRRSVKLSGEELYSGLGVEAYLCLYLGRTYSITHVLHDSSIRTLIDATRIVCHSAVNWELLRELVRKYRLFAPAHYVLSEIAEITGGSHAVPNEELEYYATTLRSHRAYDLGDFAPKLLRVVRRQSIAHVTGA
jgi:hypothetical protein